MNLALSVFLSALVCQAPNVRAAADQGDKSKVVGDWYAVYMEQDGKAVAVAPGTMMKVTFTHNEMITKEGSPTEIAVLEKLAAFADDKGLDETFDRSQYKLDDRKMPGRIDISVPHEAVSGIYELKGDQLIICTGKVRPTAFVTHPKKVRPTEFVADLKPDESLWIMRRTKALLAKTRPENEARASVPPPPEKPPGVAVDPQWRKYADEFGELALIMIGAHVDPGELIGVPSVGKELNLDEGQLEKAAKLSAASSAEKAERRAARLKGPQGEERGKKDLEIKNAETTAIEAHVKAVGQILNPEQNRRFRQIYLQFAGVTALVVNEDVQKKLKLTAAQKVKIETIAGEAEDQMMEILLGSLGDLKAAAEKMKAAGEKTVFATIPNEKFTEFGKGISTKLLTVLTDGQRQVLKEMLGAPFAIPRD